MLLSVSIVLCVFLRIHLVSTLEIMRALYVFNIKLVHEFCPDE